MLAAARGGLLAASPWGFRTRKSLRTIWDCAASDATPMKLPRCFPDTNPASCVKMYIAASGAKMYAVDPRTQPGPIPAILCSTTSLKLNTWWARSDWAPFPASGGTMVVCR